MSIMLDSAHPEEVRRVCELGFVQDVTTNPTLIAKTGRPPLELLSELVEIVSGHVFYQLTAPTVEARYDQAWEAHEIRPDKVILKIPATTENIAMAARLGQHGIECAITAVASAAQAYLAAQAEVAFVIPYVNRLTRAYGDGLAVVRQIAAVLEGTESALLAASLKSVDEVVGAVLAGAQHVTLPLELILALGEHPFSRQAIADFDTSARGG